MKMAASVASGKFPEKEDRFSLCTVVSILRVCSSERKAAT